MMPAGETADNTGAPSLPGAQQHGRDVNSTVSVIRPNLFNFLEPSGGSDASGLNLPSGQNVNATGAIYAEAVCGENPEPVDFVPDERNELPNQPLTVFFNP